jgi:3-oxoadipate enol-lactonase
MTTTAPICFKTFGNGPLHVLVLHDWFCDSSSWDSVLPYLTPARFTYVFADLRGYGLSRDKVGTCTLEEAAADAIALVDYLGWGLFSVVGHSMSSVIAQRVVQLVPERVARVAAITPVSPEGMRCDPPTVDFFRSIALANDAERFAKVSSMWGARLSETWIHFKMRRWRETANPDAVARYVELWACTDISQDARGLRTPILIVAAEQDAPPFQRASLEKAMLPYYPGATLCSLTESGHYPMQEQPPLLATLIERFLETV